MKVHKKSRTRFAVCHVILILAVSLTFVSTRSAECQIEDIENVFVVVIDGLRYSEAFGDPSYQNIPHLGNDLKPGGVLYTNIWNMGLTVTAPAHQYMITGNREFTPHYANIKVRTINPNIFEYYRKEHQIPQDKVWVIAGDKALFLRPLSYSMNPAFGESYQASFFSETGRDDMVYEQTINIIDTHEPSLVFINFGDVDTAGHHDWDRYIQAISTVDDLIYDLWNYLQGHPAYQDKTALIVTTDHGRHDDEHGLYLNHGGICDGCKRCFLLALGPGIREGTEIDMHSSLVDIASTVGYMLGFSTPFSKGRVLSGMFTGDAVANSVIKSVPGLNPGLPVRLTDSDGASRGPRIAASGNTLHLVWEEERDGVWQIYYKRSDDGGATWGEEYDVSGSPNFAVEPSISVSANDVSVVWSDYRNGNWEIYLRESEDSGLTWSPEKLVDTFQIETSGSALAPWTARVLEGSRGILAVILYTKAVLSRMSGDRGDTWDEHEIITQGFFVNDHVVVESAPFAYSMCSANNFATGKWGIWASLGSRGGAKWRTPVSVVSSAVYLSGLTAIAEDKYVYMSWSEVVEGRPEIFFLRGNQQMKTLPQPISESGAGAIYPDIAKFADGICLAWEDNRDGNKEIYYKIIAEDGLPLSGDLRLTEDDLDSTRPDLASSADNVYVVWQDNRDGNWEIYFDTVDTTVSP